jgi:hypothetical protein
MEGIIMIRLVGEAGEIVLLQLLLLLLTIQFMLIKCFRIITTTIAIKIAIHLSIKEISPILITVNN